MATNVHYGLWQVVRIQSPEISIDGIFYGGATNSIRILPPTNSLAGHVGHIHRSEHMEELGWLGQAGSTIPTWVSRGNLAPWVAWSRWAQTLSMGWALSEDSGLRLLGTPGEYGTQIRTSWSFGEHEGQHRSWNLLELFTKGDRQGEEQSDPPAVAGAEVNNPVDVSRLGRSNRHNNNQDDRDKPRNHGSREHQCPTPIPGIVLVLEWYGQDAPAPSGHESLVTYFEHPKKEHKGVQLVNLKEELNRLFSLDSFQNWIVLFVVG